jgi:hypothetical protein
MIKKLLFVAGAGVGYVLGTRAGRQQYDALVLKARKVADRPEVREMTQAVKSEANRLYDEGRQRIRAKIQTDPPERDFTTVTDPAVIPVPRESAILPDQHS